MAATTFILHTDDGDNSYTVTLEQSYKDFFRLNISVDEMGGERINSQGVDLSRDECKALGEQLILAAEKIPSK